MELSVKETARKGSPLRTVCCILSVILGIALFFSVIAVVLIPSFMGSLDEQATARIVGDLSAYAEQSGSAGLSILAKNLSAAAYGRFFVIMLAVVTGLIFLLVLLNIRHLRWLVAARLPMLLGGGALVAAAALVPSLFEKFSSAGSSSWESLVDWAYYTPYLGGFARLLYIGGGIFALLGLVFIIARIACGKKLKGAK